MSDTPQKPGEKPHKPGPKIEVSPTGKPVRPTHTEVSKPGAGHLPPTQKPNEQWKPMPSKVTRK